MPVNKGGRPPKPPHADPVVQAAREKATLKKRASRQRADQRRAVAFALGVAVASAARGPIPRPDNEVSTGHLKKRQKKAAKAVAAIVESGLPDYAPAAAAMGMAKETTAVENAMTERAAREQAAAVQAAAEQAVAEQAAEAAVGQVAAELAAVEIEAAIDRMVAERAAERVAADEVARQWWRQSSQSSNQMCGWKSGWRMRWRRIAALLTKRAVA